MSRRRLRDPQQIHDDFLRGEMDAATAADILRRQEATTAFRGRFTVPVVSGRWNDGTAQASLMLALVNLGLVIDETEQGDVAEFGGFGPAPSVVVNANAGSTATATISSGHDAAFQLGITASGVGQTAGVIASVTFTIPYSALNYGVLISPGSSAARTLGAVVGATSRATTGFDLATETALTAGGDYQWHILISTREY